jgi:hypothetical protein
LYFVEKCLVLTYWLRGHRLREARKVKSKEKKPVADQIHVRMHPGLRKLVAEKADEMNLPMSEFIAEVLANALERPDLAEVPRRKMGRPRKEMATAS